MASSVDSTGSGEWGADAREPRHEPRRHLRLDAAAIVILLVGAFGGMWLVDARIRLGLEEARALRVELDARAAFEGGQAVEGRLTIVVDTPSSRYSFPERRRYLENSRQPNRRGEALVAQDPFDLARSERHAKARRKSEALRERQPGGSFRVTVPTDGVTVELEASPPEVPHRASWTLAALAALLAIATFGLLGSDRSRLPRSIAVAVSLVSLAASLGFGAHRDFARASVAANRYLTEGRLQVVEVFSLPSVGVHATLAGILAVLAVLLILFATPVGGRIARAVARDRMPWLAAGPALFAMLVLIGVPFVVGVGLSLFRHRHGTYTFVGFDNFIELLFSTGQSFFEPQSLPYTLVMTVVWTFLNVACHLGIGLLLAMMLQNRAPRASKIYRVLLILPWAVPAYLTALIWKSMFDPDIGVVNRILGLEGMSWMNETVTAFTANLVTNVWLGFSFMMVVCLGALTSIPKDLYEAAEVDGATWWQQFARITLPLLRPALLPAVILGSIWTFNKFEVIYLVSEGRPDGATEILVTEAYKWAFERGLAQGGAYGYAASYSVIIFVVLLLYGWMTQRVSRAAEEALR